MIATGMDCLNTKCNHAARLDSLLLQVLSVSTPDQCGIMRIKSHSGMSQRRKDAHLAG